MKRKQHLTDMDEKVMFLIAVTILRAGEKCKGINYKNWKETETGINDCVEQFRIKDLSSNDCHHAGILHLSATYLKRMWYMSFHCLTNLFNLVRAVKTTWPGKEKRIEKRCIFKQCCF